MAANKEILTYIETQRAAGFSDEQIQKNLLANGWSEDAAREAFAALSSTTAGQAISTPGADSSTASLSAGINISATGEIPGVIDLFKESWKVYREKLQQILLIQLIPAVASLVFGLFVGAGVLAGIAGSLVADPGALVALLVGGGIVFLIGLVLIIVISIWAQVAFLLTILSTEKLTVTQALSGAKKYIGAAFWLGALYSAIVMGGSLFFLIPGIILSIWFIFSTYILIDEDKRGFQALVASRRYVSGKWWLVFGRVSLGSLFIIILYSITSAIFKSIDENFGNTINSFGNMLLVSPLIAIYLALLFKYIQAQKGVVDIVVTSKQKMVYGGLGLLGAIIVPLSIIAAAVLVAIDPAEQIRKARELEEGSEYQNMEMKQQLEEAQRLIEEDGEIDWEMLLEEESTE